ncbi:MAG: ABC transporter permease [Pirellulales bacterium]
MYRAFVDLDKPVERVQKMKTFAAAWTIALKDVRTFARDRVALLLGFLLPVALVTVFGFIMSVAWGGPGGMPRALLWVADEDDSEKSRRFIELLRKSEMIQVRPRDDEEAADAETARRMVHEGETPLALVIERGFGKAIAEGRLPKLTLVRDPGRTMEDRVVRVGMMQAFLAVSEGTLWPNALGEGMRRAGMSEEQTRAIVESSRGLQKIIERQVRNQTTKKDPEGEKAETDKDATPFDIGDLMGQVVPIENVDVLPPDRPIRLSYQLAQSVCGMTVMMLMFGLLGCSAMLLHERESGTLRRMLVAPIPRDSILWAKFLFCVIVGAAQLVVLFVYGNMVFDIDAFRDVPTLAMVSLTWLVAATSFGMLIAAAARSAKQAEGVSTILILVMAALGGCWFPIQMMELPPAADLATKSTLTYWAMSAYQGMFWSRQAWYEPKMLSALGVQWGFTVVASLAALVLFRRRFVAG